MKILLVQAMGYLYPWTGAHKANRIIMEGLAERGHECRVITPLTSLAGYKEKEYMLAPNKEFELVETTDQMIIIRKNGVNVYTLTSEFYIFSFIKQSIEEFEPDITIVSDNTPNLLLEAAVEANARAVFFAHSQSSLPFGPECFEESPSDTQLFKKLHGVVSVSEYVKSYFHTYAGVDSKVIYFPSYGKRPFPRLGHFDNKYITVINPSAIKGFSIFIGLAKRLPHLQFAAVPTWATSEQELEEMKSVQNITILKPAEDVNDIYKQTKVFLMPSLWGESFGQVVVEAMLRGIPVIASKVGGLPEAKLGLDYLLPVNPIKEYIYDKDIRGSIPMPVIDEQNLEPWVEALENLVHDKEHYEALSSESYTKSALFVDTLGIEPFERYFQELIDIDTARNKASNKSIQQTEQNKNHIIERINMLSNEKRERLMAALKERR